MPLFQLVVYLILIGVVLWLINSGPLAPYIVGWIKQIINVVAVVGVVLLVLSLFWPFGWGPWIGRHR